MDDSRTTVAVQRYLDDLAARPGDAPDEAIVRELLGRSVNRLHQLCATMLMRSYPRLARPPFNLQSEELLSAVVERLLKAMKKVKPGSVRQYFALVNQHMRWELNDLARRLDQEEAAVRLRDSLVPACPESNGSEISDEARRIIAAIEGLPDEEREVFDLVRVQGMAQTEAADLLGISAKTVQRRLNRALVLLTTMLGDLGGDAVADAVGEAADPDAGGAGATPEPR